MPANVSFHRIWRGILAHSRLSGLLLVAASALQRTVEAGSSAAEDSNLRIITGVLESLSSEDQSVRLKGRDKLERIGAPLTPLIFDILVGHIDLNAVDGKVAEEGERPLLDARTDAFLREVLASFPPAEVSASLRKSITPEAPIDERWVAVRLIGECGDQACVEDLFAILKPVEEIQLGRPYVRSTVEDALSAILTRDPGAHRSLRELLPDIHPALMPSIIRCLGRAGRTASFLLLLDLLSKEPELASAILLELGRADPRDYDTLVEDCSRVARHYLGNEDASLQRSAIALLGTLRDQEAMQHLASRVDPKDPGLNRVVLRALKESAGLDLGPDGKIWSQWLAAEERWSVTSLQGLAGDASSRDPVVATAALRRISEHPLFHRKLYPFVLPALRHPSESVIRAACLTLERLGDPGALESLYELLSDPRDPVKMAAHHALVSLSGQTFPPLVETWSGWLHN